MVLLALLTGCDDTPTGFHREAEVQDCTDCPVMVTFGPGTFVRGAGPDDAPDDALGKAPKWGRYGERHEARIVKPFAVAKLNVTRAEFHRFVVETGYEPVSKCRAGHAMNWKWSGTESRDEALRRLAATGTPLPAEPYDYMHNDLGQTGDHPVTCVNYDDAYAYIAWVNRTVKPDGVPPYRLMEEAEWEYATRAGTETRYYWGNDPEDACRWANVGDRTKAGPLAAAYDEPIDCDDGYLFTSPVGTFPANPAGLHDMLGNLLEMLQGPWVQNLEHAWPQGDPPTAEECSRDPACTPHRSPARGGGWYSSDWKLSINHRSAYISDRAAIDQEPVGDPWIGFRLARDVAPAEHLD